jgi:hypothetical protein
MSPFVRHRNPASEDCRQRRRPRLRLIRVAGDNLALNGNAFGIVARDPIALQSHRAVE